MSRITIAAHAVLAVIVATAVIACSGGSDGGGAANPSAPTAPENVNRITISATGVASPTELVVPPGARVLFVNNHGQSHQMSSDPHPDHTDCPEINQAGLLNTGESRETGNLVAVRTCGFHDHQNPTNSSLRGRIVIR
jgi:plastocyanin